MTVFKNFAIYGLAGTASRLVMVFLVPLYTRVLSIEQYGELEFLLAAAAFLTIVVGVQSESAVLREYHQAVREKRSAELRSGALAIAGGGSAVIALACALAWISGVLPGEYVRLLPLVLAIAIATQILGIQLVLLRFDDSPVIYGLVTFGDVLIASGISVLLLVEFGWGVEGALAGVLVGKLVGVAGAWRRTFPLISLTRPEPALILRMLAFCVPATAPVMLNWAQLNGARIVLAAFFSLADVALVSIGIRVAALFGFLVYAFRLAWEPWAFRLLDDPDRSADAYGRVLKLYVIGMLLVGTFAIAINPLLVVIFAPPKYAAAVTLCGGFVMGQLWLGIGNLTSIGIHGSRKTTNLVTVSLAAALVNLGLLAVLAPFIGVAGAMIAFLAGGMARGFAASAISNRLYSTGFSMRLLGTAAAASIGLSAAAYGIFARYLNQPLVGQVEAMALMLAIGVITVALTVWAAIPAADLRVAVKVGGAQWRLAVRALRSRNWRF